jgi:hypothetical protein
MWARDNGGISNGAGDRDRTGDIQLGKVHITFIINNLQKQQSAEIDPSGLKGILTAGAKEGFRPMNTRVSACSSATPFSTPLEHRETARTTRVRIVQLEKSSGNCLNSVLSGLLMVLIASLSRNQASLLRLSEWSLYFASPWPTAGRGYTPAWLKTEQSKAC